jgi:hypothetical protein
MRALVHDPGMNSRVHPKYKTKYRVNNWAEYDRALVRRGDIEKDDRRNDESLCVLFLDDRGFLAIPEALVALPTFSGPFRHT